MLVLGAQGVKVVLVDSRGSEPWRRDMGVAGLSASDLGGVLVYTVPSAVLAGFSNATPHQMAAQEAMRAFSVLVEAADRYVDGAFRLLTWVLRRPSV